jgi:hypothetical protein
MPVGSDNKVLVSMSTTFYPREDHPSDLIIISSDNVFFSVHKRVLLERSQNAFGGQLYHKDYQSFTGKLSIFFPISRSSYCNELAYSFLLATSPTLWGLPLINRIGQ